MGSPIIIPNCENKPFWRSSASKLWSYDSDWLDITITSKASFEAHRPLICCMKPCWRWEIVSGWNYSGENPTYPGEDYCAHLATLQAVCGAMGVLIGDYVADGFGSCYCGSQGGVTDGMSWVCYRDDYLLPSLSPTMSWIMARLGLFACDSCGAFLGYGGPGSFGGIPLEEGESSTAGIVKWFSIASSNADVHDPLALTCRRYFPFSSSPTIGQLIASESSWESVDWSQVFFPTLPANPYDPCGGLAATYTVNVA